MTCRLDDGREDAHTGCAVVILLQALEVTSFSLALCHLNLYNLVFFFPFGVVALDRVCECVWSYLCDFSSHPDLAFFLPILWHLNNFVLYYKPLINCFNFNKVHS